MGRSLAALSFFAILGSALVAGLFWHFTNAEMYAEHVKFHSYVEFDFASYDFGVVAVALSFAGVFISVIPDRCSEQVKALLKLHLTPEPFEDITELEKKLHPDAVRSPAPPTEGPICAYAIVMLGRWASLTDGERAQYLGRQGISRVRPWIGSAYKFLQNKTDRLLVACSAIVIATTYILVPFAYMLRAERLAVSMLITIYIMCILEMIMCAALYIFRSYFIHVFEARMAPWKADVLSLLLILQMHAVPKIPEEPNLLNIFKTNGN